MAIKIQNNTIIDDGRNIVDAGITTVSALNISTTEVISAARQLKNIASLDATTTSTIEAAIANAPNTFTDINVTGIATLSNVNVTGVITATSFSGTATSTTNIPNLSGDVTSNNTVTTLATVNSNVGTYGGTGAIPVVTVNGKGLVTGVSTVAPNNGQLTLGVSGTGLSGSATFTANQSGNSTFTVISNATSSNTNNTIVSRDSSGGFSAGTIVASNINVSGVTTTARLNVGTGGTIVTTTSSGFIGINTTNPQSTLSVGGTITELYNGTYWNVVTQADVGYGASQVPLNQYLGQLAFLDDFSANGLRREGGGVDDVTVNSSGFVGIATTNPIQPIQINSAFNSNVLVVDASGDLGIGTTNPSSKLHIIGDALLTGVVTATRFIGNVTGNLNSTGVNTATTISGTTLTYTNGSITNASGTNLNYTGISTITNVRSSSINNTGVTTSTTYNTGTVGSQTSGILTTTATTANQVLDNLPTATFQTARYQVSIACVGQLITDTMTTDYTSVGAITAGAGYTDSTYTNVALTGGSGNDARANIGIGLSFNSVGFTSATDLLVTTTEHGLSIGSGSLAVSFASSIPDSGFTGYAVTAGNIYYAVGVGTTTFELYNDSGATSQVTGIGITDFVGVANTMTKAGGVSSVEIVYPGSGYVVGNTLSATLGSIGSGFSFVVSNAVKNYQSTDIMIMQSVGSASTACDYIEYGTIANSEVLGSFSADISGSNARLLITPTYRNNTIKLVRTGITV